MQSTEFVFETADAMALAGIARRQWDTVMARGIYPGAPPVKAGHPRYFTRDDMVCLYIFKHYSEETDAPMAGRVATAVRKELKKGGEDLEKLWVVLTKAGVPRYVVHREPPSDLIRHEIDVAKARAVIEKFATERLGWVKP